MKIGYRELWRRRHELLFKKEYGRAPRYARWVSHRLTPALVYAALRLGLTPNQVTVISLVTGIAGCWALLSGDLPWMLAGALLVEAYYLLDSVDGQLARLTRRFSKSGTFLDVLGNYVVPPAVFVSLGAGLTRAGGDWAHAFLGGCGALGCVWLGAIWDVRGNLILTHLRKQGGAVAGSAAEHRAPVSGDPGPAARIFSIVHKLCTYPSVMNLLTLAAAVSWACGTYAPAELYLILYALALPAVSLAKAAKMFSSGEIDREYESCGGHGA